ncbi:hypothetical protein QLX08_003302 [Tetragonisca angustula]|uniref:Uncharacterized protein n=1 Tax=Tetragonisca angustula TaxID=166442 RepID=A0AAW1A924_9HYME
MDLGEPPQLPRGNLLEGRERQRSKDEKEEGVKSPSEKQDTRNLSFIRESGFEWNKESSKLIYRNETRQRRTSNDERA